MTCRHLAGWMLHAFVVMMAATHLAAAFQQLRDRPRPPASGSAMIAGVVLSGETPARPLRRARVTLASPDHPYGATAITDDDGGFVFEGLAAGRYTVSASKPAYLPMSCGAARSGRSGRVIELRPGDTQTCTIRLDRGSVISGTVADLDGHPASGVTIDVLAYRSFGGMRRLTTIGAVAGTTDDRGEYRIFGLAPGEYYITARPIGRLGDLLELSDREIRRALAEVGESRAPARPGWGGAPAARRAPGEPTRPVRYAPVFHPGTTVAARAQPVRLGVAEERHGIDIQLERVPSASIAGTVTAPDGPSRFTMVTLSPRRSSDDAAAGLPFEMIQTAGAGAGGMFAFRSLPPGEYTIHAQVMTAAGGPLRADTSGGVAWASTDVILDGDDIAGVSLVLQPPLSISGRVVFEGASPPPELPVLQRTLPLSRPEARVAAALPHLRIEADGRFVLSGIVPGLHVLADTQGLRTPIGRWWLKSVVVNGRDLLRSPLELRDGSRDAVVTFTSEPTEISGTVQDPDGIAPAEAHVIAFPVEPAGRFFHSPQIAAARLRPGARYAIRNLPAGDYFVAAVADMHAGEWWDPEVLERLAPVASRVRLRDRDRVTLDAVLRPVTPDR